MAIGIGIGLTFGRRKGIDAQAQAAFNSLQSAGFTTPQGITGINAAFKTIKTIYGTSDITTAISFFGDPSLAYQIGAGSGTTLGQAIRTLPNIIDPTRATDAVQTTAASQPLLLVHEGANYYYSGATSGNYVSTPDSVNATFSGDLDVRIRIRNFVNNQTQVYITKRTSSGFVFYSDNFGILNLEPWNVLSTAAVPNGFNGWLRMTKTATEIRFFTGNDTDTPTFTQLGTTIIGTFSNPSANSNILGIGGVYNTSTLTYFPSYCKILRVTKANSIGGAPVVDFNPNQYNPSTSQTQWTSSTGEVWTINTGTATSGYKGVLVDRTIVQSDGIDDTLVTATLNISGARTNYASIRAYQNSADSIFFDGNNFPPFQNLLRQYSGGSVEFNSNGAVGLFSPSLINKLATIVSNTTQSSIQINNGSVTSASITGATLVALRFFRSGLGTFSQSGVVTFILSRQADNSTQRTDMYNYIRSINNNAF